ncbi:hypothetical protein PMAYCL1PPCAC_14459, partial [Pristionchus mayeri]
NDQDGKQGADWIPKHAYNYNPISATPPASTTMQMQNNEEWNPSHFFSEYDQAPPVPPILSFVLPSTSEELDEVLDEGRGKELITGRASHRDSKFYVAPII